MVGRGDSSSAWVRPSFGPADRSAGPETSGGIFGGLPVRRSCRRCVGWSRGSNRSTPRSWSGPRHDSPGRSRSVPSGSMCLTSQAPSTHYWGRRLMERWVWVSATQFEGQPQRRLEGIIGGRSRLFGRIPYPLPISFLWTTDGLRKEEIVSAVSGTIRARVTETGVEIAGGASAGRATASSRAGVRSAQRLGRGHRPDDVRRPQGRRGRGRAGVGRPGGPRLSTPAAFRGRHDPAAGCRRLNLQSAQDGPLHAGGPDRPARWAEGSTPAGPERGSATRVKGSWEAALTWAGVPIETVPALGGSFDAGAPRHP